MPHWSFAPNVPCTVTKKDLKYGNVTTRPCPSYTFVVDNAASAFIEMCFNWYHLKSHFFIQLQFNNSPIYGLLRIFHYIDWFYLMKHLAIYKYISYSVVRWACSCTMHKCMKILVYSQWKDLASVILNSWAFKYTIRDCLQWLLQVPKTFLIKIMERKMCVCRRIVEIKR